MKGSAARSFCFAGPEAYVDGCLRCSSINSKPESVNPKPYKAECLNPKPYKPESLNPEPETPNPMEYWLSAMPVRGTKLFCSGASRLYRSS